MKKALCLFLGFLLCLSSFPFVPSSSAQGIASSGNCGSRVTWEMDTNGALTISGRGEMDNFDSGKTPWDKDAVTSVIVNSGVTSVGAHAFWYCSNLKTVTLADSLSTIGKYAFYQCISLATISFPSEMSSIGENAFSGCTSLTSLSLPNGLSTIDERVFQGCSNLQRITFGLDLKEIGFCAFYDCNRLTELSLPEGLLHIHDYAFWRCRELTSLSLPASLISIGKWCLYNCTKLESISVSSDNPLFSSRNGIIYSKDGSELILCPQGICGSIILPRGLTSVSLAAFEGCTGLTDITIPASVTTIADTAFSECDVLRTVYYEGDREQWSSVAIGKENDQLIEAEFHYMDHPDYDISADERTNCLDIYILYRCFMLSNENARSIRALDMNRDGCFNLLDVSFLYSLVIAS